MQRHPPVPERAENESLAALVHKQLFLTVLLGTTHDVAPVTRGIGRMEAKCRKPVPDLNVGEIPERFVGGHPGYCWETRVPHSTALLEVCPDGVCYTTPHGKTVDVIRDACHPRPSRVVLKGKADKHFGLDSIGNPQVIRTMIPQVIGKPGVLCQPCDVCQNDGQVSVPGGVIRDIIRVVVV